MVKTNEGLMGAIFSLADLLELPSEAFDNMANLAVKTVPGCEGASVSVLEADGQVTTAGASDERTVLLDKLQYNSQEGPCLSAMSTATTVQVDDFGRDSRYPTFGPGAAALGVASCLSVPLTASDGTVGGLNLYGEVPYAYGELAVAAGQTMAAHTSLLVATRQGRRRSLDLVDKQQVALASRAEIEQAKGILMAGSHCDADQAFDILRRASQRQNLKLRDIAPHHRGRHLELAERPPANSHPVAGGHRPARAKEGAHPNVRGIDLPRLKYTRSTPVRTASTSLGRWGELRSIPALRNQTPGAFYRMSKGSTTSMTIHLAYTPTFCWATRSSEHPLRPTTTKPLSRL